MNVVCLMGRLTADPELKTTPDGVSVVSFRLAVNRDYKNPDGTYPADFINCVAWRQKAEFICKYFVKGDLIGVAGSLQSRQYTDKETGKNRTAFEVLVNDADFAQKRQSDADKMRARRRRTTADLDNFRALASDDEDLPF